MIKCIFRVRPLRWLFRRNWYSLYRWRNPVEQDGETVRLIDMGPVTVGYRRSTKWQKR